MSAAGRWLARGRLAALLALALARGALAQEPEDAEGFADAAPASDAEPPPEPVSEPSAQAALPASAAASSEEEGFADAMPAAAAQPTRASLPEGESRSHFHLSGAVIMQGALRVERTGGDRLGKARLVFAPRLEYKRALTGAASSISLVAAGRVEADFAYLLRPYAYDAPTMELYGSQLIPGTTYLSLAGANFELAFGQQIVNFGQSEVLSLLDAVNPRDLREPLFADLEELRLPVLMTRVALSFEPLRAELLLVHEPNFGLLPSPAGEFSPLRKYLRELPGLGALLDRYELRYRHVPGRDPTQFGATQAHARLTLRLSQVDLSLQAASLLDAQGVPVFPGAGALRATRLDLVTYHPRYTLLGQSGVATLGKFLLRWELAVELSRPFVVRFKQRRLPPLASERLHSVRALLGLTYVPNARTNLGLELLVSRVLDNPARRPRSDRTLLFPVEAPQLALRLSQQFLRDKLTLTVVALSIGLFAYNAFAARAELSYALSDALRLSCGAVTFQPTRRFGPFYGFERNDRVYASLRWSFAAN